MRADGQLRTDIIAQAVPLWRRTRAAICKRRPLAQADNRRKDPLPSVDDLLRANGIGKDATTFDELAEWAEYERAIRLAATEAA